MAKIKRCRGCMKTFPFHTIEVTNPNAKAGQLVEGRDFQRVERILCPSCTVRLVDEDESELPRHLATNLPAGAATVLAQKAAIAPAASPPVPVLALNAPSVQEILPADTRLVPASETVPANSVTTFTPGSAVEQDYQRSLLDRDQLMRDLNDARRMLGVVRADLQRAEGECSALRARLSAKEGDANEALARQIATTAGERDRLRAELIALQATHGAVAAERAQLATKVAGLEAAFAAQQGKGCAHVLRFEQHSDDPPTTMKRRFRRVERCTKCGIIVSDPAKPVAALAPSPLFAEGAKGTVILPPESGTDVAPALAAELRDAQAVLDSVIPPPVM